MAHAPHHGRYTKHDSFPEKAVRRIAGRPAYTGSVRLRLAAEYMLDNLFKERLDNNDLLSLGEQGTKLLIETSYYNPPVNMFGLLDRIKTKGYYPVLAHPERYGYMTDTDYKTLKEIGTCFQLNLLSLFGVYGKEARKKAERMLKEGEYEMAGTDTHSKTNCMTCMENRYSNASDIAEALLRIP